MTVQTSKLGEYVVEGTEKRVIIARLGEYVVEGPQLVVPAAPRRRQVHLP